MLDGLRDIPIVGDVRGAGYFHAIELVKDQDTKESFSHEESEHLLRGFLSGELYRRGPDLPRGRPRRPGRCSSRPPLICDTRAVRGDRGRAAAGAHRGGRADRPGLVPDRGHLSRRRSRSRELTVLTVRSLVGEMRPRAGRGARTARDNPVRWVHISEHADPTPWLSGGELMLTTGLQPRHSREAAALRRAARRQGPRRDSGSAPGSITSGSRRRSLDAAAAHGLPLFEVPYEMPFIAITERAAAKLVNEQFGVLERGAHVHERLERLVIEGRGLDEILGSTGAAVGGAAMVIDRAGRELARSDNGNGSPSATGPIARPGRRDRRAAGRRAARAVRARARGARRTRARDARSRPARRRPGRLAGCDLEREPLGDFERLCARQAAPGRGPRADARANRARDRAPARRRPARRRARRSPRRRRAQRAPAPVRDRLPRRPSSSSTSTTRTAAEATLESALADAGVPALVATSAASGRAASVRGRRRRWVGPARNCAPGARGARRRPWAQRRARRRQPTRARQLAAPRLPRGALRARRRPRSPTVARPMSPRTATSAPSRCSWRFRTTTPCASTATTCSTRSSGPRASTEASCCARSRPSSRTTAIGSGRRGSSTATGTPLRYRIRKIEELTGRDLGSATDRIELWLALRARELVR